MTPSDGARARALLSAATAEDEAFILRFAREAPLLYGTWRYLKGLYKDAETAGAPAVLGTLIGRLDTARPIASAGSTNEGPDVRDYLSVAADDKTAVFTRRTGIQVVDLSEGGVPRLATSVNLGSCNQVAVAGRRAAVEVGGARGEADRVWLLDLAEPERPVLLGSVEVRALMGVALEGTHLFLVEGVGQQQGRLRIFDVSHPDQPVHLSTLELRNARGIVLSHGRAYIGTTRSRNVEPGLHVVDVADPQNPRYYGFYRIDAELLLVGGTALTTPQQNGKLAVVDPSIPPSPQPEIQMEAPGVLRRFVEMFSPAQERPRTLSYRILDLGYARNIRSVAVYRDHAYLGYQYGGVRVLSLSDLSLGHTLSYSHVHRLFIAGNTLYQPSTYGGWARFSLTNPARPSQLGNSPSMDTLEYLRRRARRLLRNLARTNPERFVEVAYHALIEAGRGQTAVNTANYWVSVDLLYGGSGRYEHKRHGRGRCVARWTGTRRRTREERAPEAWDRRPDLVLALCTHPDLPWQTYETMLKIVQARGEALPPLPGPVRLRYLRSPSPLLVRAAARQVAGEIEAGKKVDAETAARAFFASPPAVRARLAPQLLTRAGSPAWARPFAATLVLLASLGVGEGPISGRVRDAAGLLTRGFGPFLASEPLLAVVDRLVRDGSPELLQLVWAGFRAVTLTSLPQWLGIWTGLPGPAQGPAWDALVAGLRRTGLGAELAWTLVSAPEAAVRDAAWRLLLALSVPPDVATAVWNAVLAAEEETAALRTAVGSAAALELLRRSGLELDSLVTRVAAMPTLAALLSPEALEAFVASVPVAGIPTLIQSVSELRWPELREAVLRGLRGSGRLAAFWKALPAALTDTALQTRLLEDPLFTASLLEVSDPSLVEITDAPFEALLHRWITSHPELFPAGSASLVAAATHPLPAVRTWGLVRAAEVGMDMQFALRLLESDVPPAVEAGKAFFHALPPGDPAELYYGLALCDSPDRAVRAFGREYLQSRRETLPAVKTLRSLSEHGDAEMNRFLAELLLRPDGAEEEEVQAAAEIRAFDRGVLRSRNRGRRAKEQVKTRLSIEPEPDVSLLLELARGGTPRDAEWALSQLARLAVEGREIEGVTQEGPVGI